MTSVSVTPELCKYFVVHYLFLHDSMVASSPQSPSIFIQTKHAKFIYDSFKDIKEYNKGG